MTGTYGTTTWDDALALVDAMQRPGDDMLAHAVMEMSAEDARGLVFRLAFLVSMARLVSPSATPEQFVRAMRAIVDDLP